MRPNLVETSTNIYYCIIQWDQCYRSACAWIIRCARGSAASESGNRKQQTWG